MEFAILGPLEVREGELALTLPGRKERALLALLLLNANQVVSCERLLEDLWSGEPPESGLAALRVRVSQLRKALGEGSRLLVTKGSGYMIAIDAEQFDLHRFERLLTEAGGSEPALAAGMLREALALWRGEALAEFAYESFARSAIERLEELRLTALERRIQADLDLGRNADLVGELEALVAVHPLRELLRGQLMLALYRSGRQAEALEAYKRTRRALVEELGIEPSRALQELEGAILRQDPSLDLAQLASPSRSILVVPRDDRRMESLLALAEPLARRPPRELIVACMVSAADDLEPTTARLHALREALLAKGQAARAAAFVTGREHGHDLIRLASEQDVDLLLLEAGEALLEDDVTTAVLEGAPCDVAVLVRRGVSTEQGPVLVPFTGAEHDWSAVELGAWIARNQEVPLRLVGPQEEERDASRLLASASLVVQRALGVAATPLLVEPGPQALVRAAEDAALVVIGLSERWRSEGLGRTRLALATETSASALLVRRGLRPGGLAPRESQTRFTWSLVVSAS